MSKLMHRDPFWQEVLDFRQNFDDIFSRFFNQPVQQNSPNAEWVPPMDSYVDQGKLHVKLAIPGVDPKQVSVQVHGNQLTISGERSVEQHIERENYLRQEISFGRFERTLMLPDGVMADKLEAAYNAGELQLTAPFAEKALPRTVEVKVLSNDKTKGIAA